MPEVKPVQIWFYNLESREKRSFLEAASRMINSAMSNPHIDYLLTRELEAKVGYIGEKVIYFDEEMRKAPFNRSLWGTNYRLWQRGGSIDIANLSSSPLFEQEPDFRRLQEAVWALYADSPELRNQNYSILALYLPNGKLRLIARSNYENTKFFTSV